MTQSCDRLFEQLSREITEACFVNSINSSEVIRKMSEYDNKKKDSSLFVVTRHYTRMVMMMLSFIKAGTYWGLAATSSFPRTLHQIFLCWWQDQLCTNDPCLPCWDFSPKDDKPHNTLRIHNGNWVVNKNKDVSLFAVEGDNALVSGGLVGITLNASGRTKFFS